MSNNNPLKQYFRQPSLYVKLPTQGRWYSSKEVETSETGELAVYGLTALDEIMLNTPDAMLNGTALEKVLQNCVPGFKQIKKIALPDLEAIFLAMKIATSDNKFELTRTCPKCDHENNFDIDCRHLIDTMSYIEDSDTVVSFNDELVIHLKPYTFELRQIWVQKEINEERTLRAIDADNKDLDDFQKAKILSESVEKISKITFELAAKSIEKIIILKDKSEVTDPAFISEWLMSISSVQADNVLKQINVLNDVGPQKTVTAACENCGHQWEEKLNFDPVSFFGKRSQPQILT
jgi:hypothetical protein